MIERLRACLAFENRFVQVRDDEVRFADGSEGRHVVVSPVPSDHPGVVVIAVADRRVALVRTYRYPIQDYQWGLPRGLGHGPDVLQSARVELQEEAGAAAESIRILGTITPDSGLLSARVAVVLAEVTTPPVPHTDTAEVSDVRWVTPEELRTMIGAGQLEDAFTLAAWALWSTGS